jgi:hypothetical protein
MGDLRPWWCRAARRTGRRASSTQVAAAVQVGNRIVAGGQFTKVASAAAPTTAIARSNIFAFDATTGASDPAFAPALDARVEAGSPRRAASSAPTPSSPAA